MSPDARCLKKDVGREFGSVGDQWPAASGQLSFQVSSFKVLRYKFRVSLFGGVWRLPEPRSGGGAVSPGRKPRGPNHFTMEPRSGASPTVSLRISFREASRVPRGPHIGLLHAAQIVPCPRCSETLH